MSIYQAFRWFSEQEQGHLLCISICTLIRRGTQFEVFQCPPLFGEEHSLRCFIVYPYSKRNTIWGVSACTLIWKGTRFEVFQRRPLFHGKYNLRCFIVHPYLKRNTIWRCFSVHLYLKRNTIEGVSMCTRIWKGAQFEVFQCAALFEEEHSLRCF